MTIDDLEMAYNNFDLLMKYNNFNGKAIIDALLKICELENKLIYEMFYDKILINILDDKTEELCAELNCDINYDILLDPINNKKLNIDKYAFRKIVKIKNHLNLNLQKFMFLNNNDDISMLCDFINKYSEQNNISQYWTIKNFLNKKFMFLEESYEKTCSNN